MALTKVSNDLITDSTIAIGKLNTSGTASSSVSLKGDFSWGAAASTSGKWNCAASAPGSPTAGDIWYTGGKIYIAVGTDYSGWNTGPNCNNAAQHMGNAGTTSAGLTWGGHRPGGAHNKTEEYNGSVWTQVNNMLATTNAMGSSGTQTAALSWAGLTPNITNATHEYDGTSWSAGGNFSASAEYASGFGTQSNTTSAAGEPYSTNCYEYNGSSWSTGGTRARSTKQCAGSGATGSAGIVMGGYHVPTYSGETEEYNGTSWSAGGQLPYNYHSEMASWGTLTATVGCGGQAGTRDNDLGKTDWTGIYDGTAWSAAQTMITIKSGFNGSGIGSTSSGMLVQGYSYNQSKETCEEFSSNIGIWYTKEVGYT
tara:strand:+ start:1390 stop:2493 length:1104 start_codon:yes stop_codon:yes gene_type:complete